MDRSGDNRLFCTRSEMQTSTGQEPRARPSLAPLKQRLPRTVPSSSPSAPLLFSPPVSSSMQLRGTSIPVPGRATISFQTEVDLAADIPRTMADSKLITCTMRCGSGQDVQ